MELKDLERVVRELSADDLQRFADWFDELRAEVWDQQIERDSTAGHLDALLRMADTDFDAGRAEAT